jgi:hypothetical protein
MGEPPIRQVSFGTFSYPTVWYSSVSRPRDTGQGEMALQGRIQVGRRVW